MIKHSKAIAMAVAATLMALGAIAANAEPGNRNLGAARGGARSSINHGGGGAMARQGGGNYANVNRPGNNPGGRPGKNRPGKGGNVVAGNTVVVGGQGGRGGYNNNGRYNNGGYNNNGHWDNDDNDFLEFVGKTAAITAGVSVVSAVIGSTVNDRPDDCQQSMSNGQVYMNCNGTWYQPVMNGNQQQYQVINPPR